MMLAKRAGLSRQTLSLLELGKREPTWATVRVLARALGVTCLEFDEGESVAVAEQPTKKAGGSLSQETTQSVSTATIPTDLPPGLIASLDALAERMGRTWKAELVLAIERHLAYPPAPPRLDPFPVEASQGAGEPKLDARKERKKA
jgi:transcriptional regulator with XRE-family HTH domain